MAGMQPVSRWPGREAGVSAILVAASLLLILGMAALVVDIGSARVDRLELQNAADSAALAGAFELPGDAGAARDAAAEYAYLGVDLSAPGGVACGIDTECFDVGGYTLRVTTPYAKPGSSRPPEDVIRVQMCTAVPSSFGRVLGSTSIDVCGDAVAAATPAGAGDCVICILNPTGTTFSSTGAGRVNVRGGDIVVNSDSSQALSLSGGGRITTDGEFGINGGFSATAGALTPVPTHHDPVADPLAHLPVPTVGGPSAGKVSISGSSNITLTPGIYSEIVSSSSGQITLQPGIYVITRQIKLSKSPSAGNVSLYAHGVMIYFACSSYPAPCAPGESGANISQSGGASVSWTPPTSGPFKGVSLFADRNNTSAITLTGSSGTSFSGSIYAKSGTLSMTGPSGVATDMDSLLVVGAFKKTGDSAINVSYDAANGPPGVGGTGGSRLVG
jgi:hypothetical protein